MQDQVDVHMLAGDSGARGEGELIRYRIDAPAEAGGTAPWHGIAIVRAGSPAPEGSVEAWRAQYVEGKAGPDGGAVLLAVTTLKDGIDRAEGFRHWQEHIPLANTVHHGTVSYRQFRFVETLTAGAPDYLGLAALAFSDAAAIGPGLFREVSDMALIAEDVADFVGEAITMIGRPV